MRRDKMIIESLGASRKDLILEAADSSVTNGFKDFLKKSKMDTKDTARIRKALNDLFLVCNSVCDNSMKYGKYSYTAPTMDQGDAENGPAADGFQPGSHRFEFWVFFNHGSKDRPFKALIQDIINGMKVKKHFIYNDYGDYEIDTDPSSDTDSTVMFTSRESKTAIVVTIIKSINAFDEGTDVSGVATPTGRVGEVHKEKDVQTIKEAKKDKEEPKAVCPECGSEDVNIHNEGSIFHCVTCGYEWDVTDADDCGKDDDKETPEEIKSHTKKKISSEDSKEDKPKKKEEVTESIISFSPGAKYVTSTMRYFEFVSNLPDNRCMITCEGCSPETMKLSDLLAESPMQVR